MFEHIKEYIVSKFGRGQNVDVPLEDLSRPLFVLQKGESLPENAEMLDMHQVLQQQRQRISKWKNKWDICFLQFGSNILGLGGSAFGIYIVGHYRMMFNITRGGIAASYFAPTMMSYMVCLAMNEWTTKSQILTKTQGDCEACMEVKAGLNQGIAGGLLPVVSAFLSAMLAANKHNTYPLPSAFDFRGNAKLFVKMFPKSNIVPIAVLLQMSLGMAVAKGQLKDFDKLMSNMYSRNENKLDY